MKRHEDSFLDHSLKDVDSKIIWNESSKQQVRRDIISTINQEKHSKYKSSKHMIKNTVIPIFAFLLFVGISLPLVFSQINLGGSEPEQPAQTIPSGDETDSDSEQLDLNYKLPQEQQAQLNDIKNTDFDIRLPKNSIDKNMVASNILKRDAGAGEHVSVAFRLNGEKIYDYWQESVNDKEIMDAAINRIKDSSFKEININSKTAYLVEKNERLSLYIMTENYGLTLTSFHLTIDELVDIASSIDLTGLK